jgi:hypothetical protein
LELVQRELRFLERASTEGRADEDRSLALGPRFVKRRQLTAFLSRSTPSSRRSSSKVREKRT